MNNYKIRVNNEVESRDAQELFFELGYEWQGHGKKYKHLNQEWINANSNGFLTWGFTGVEAQKLITLPQLRDLVVLHRNDIDDASWETEGDDQIYEDSSGKSFIFREQGWDELQRHEMRQAMWAKPKSPSPVFAEMSEVKEYLDPNENYSYHKVPVIAQGSGWIEIPEGADLYAYWPKDKSNSFHAEKSFFESDEWSCCAWDIEAIKSGEAGVKILWQRNSIQNTQPEPKFQTIKVKGLEGLMEGTAALRAALDGETVQFSLEPWEEKHWDDFLPNVDGISTRIFFTGTTKEGQKVFFRLKPRTILINGIEVPAPFEPKIGEECWVLNESLKYGDGYKLILSHENGNNYNFGAWDSEVKVKQVVAALRKVFEVQS